MTLDRTTPASDSPVPDRVEIWDKVIGPLWPVGVVLWLYDDTISRADVRAMVARLELLEVRTDEGWPLYPAFQFDQLAVNPNLVVLLQEFRGAPVDGWAIAAWFSTPSDALDGECPRRRLTRRDPVDLLALRALAAETARRWSADRITPHTTPR